MADRGDFRAFYVAFGDDPDVHALSHLAFRVLVTLKLGLPAVGIGVVYAAQLCEQCRCTREELDAALAELEAPKDGGPLGWIVRERNVVWIVNGLRYEPSLNPRNVAKHRPFVERHLKPLGDKPIVRLFRTHYPEWFEHPDTATDAGRGHGSDNGSGSLGHAYPMGSDTLSEGYRNLIDRLSKHGEGDSEGEGDSDVHGDSHGDGDGDTARASRPGSGSSRPACPAPAPRSPSPADARSGTTAAEPGPLPPDAQRFLDRHYGHALPERRASVLAQLEQARLEGVKHKRQRVRAVDDAHLAEACRHVCTLTFRDPNVAIGTLFDRLAETELDARRVRAQRAEAEAEQAAQHERAERLRLAAAWAATTPEAEAQIAVHVEQLPATVPDRRELALLAAWAAAGEPTLVHVGPT